MGEGGWGGRRFFAVSLDVTWRCRLLLLSFLSSGSGPYQVPGIVYPFSRVLYFTQFLGKLHGNNVGYFIPIEKRVQLSSFFASASRLVTCRVTGKPASEAPPLQARVHRALRGVRSGAGDGERLQRAHGPGGPEATIRAPGREEG